ncbi:class I SAM-dependent methyltransferase [Sinomicrobium sp. M5D2P9]
MCVFSTSFKMKKSSIYKAEKFWDRAASSYDREEKKDKETYLQITEKLKGCLKPTDIILDFGCATGIISNEIASSVKKVHAIDISSKMIINAKAKAEARKIHNIEYTKATIFDKGLKTGTFDVVLASYILHLVEDTQIVVQRIKELLKPGGLIISVTPCMGEKPVLSGCLSMLGRMGFVPRIKSFEVTDLQGLLTAEGFEILKNEKLPKTSDQYFIVVRKL